MQLTLREAARYLDVKEAIVRKWVAERNLPVHHADERVYLNAVELWEWAVENGVPVSRRLLDHAKRAPDPVPPMDELLTAGGIHHDIDASDKMGVLYELVARLPLPPDQNRDTLLSVLEAREAMGSTGIGDGIAIPHVRNPIVLRVPEPFVTLGLLRHPVEFDAIDGKPVHAIFMVVSPTVPVHLRILGELGFLLRDAILRNLMRERAPADEILGRIALLEATRTTASFRQPAQSTSADTI
jgi:PTS system nitrogen regulatory IIA component